MTVALRCRSGIVVVLIVSLLSSVSLVGATALVEGWEDLPIFSGSYCNQCTDILGTLQKDLGNVTEVNIIISAVQQRLCDPLPILERKIVCTNTHTVSDVSGLNLDQPPTRCIAV
jgi:hypothetical protein